MPEPVKWKNGKVKSDFEAWLASEIFHAMGDRQDFERQLAVWIEQFRAPRRGSSDFPYEGSSNEELPLTAMHAEPVMAQIMQSLHATNNLWTAVDLNREFTDSVNAVTEFMTVIDRNFLKMRKVNRRAIPEAVILGTMVYHPTWQFERRKSRGYDEAGRVISNVRTLNRPVCRHIPIADFIWPANSWDTDPDEPVAPARWVGHRFRLTRNQLNAMGRGQEPFLPDFDPEGLELVLERETQEEDTVENKIRDLDQMKPSWDRKIELYRIEARFDTDDDGIDEDIVVIFHYPTATILQSYYNFWHHGKRLYEVEQYIQTFSLLGMGIAEMNEWAQATVSKLLNATINNATLSNTRMFGIPEGMMFGPNEPIYPGKIIPLGPGEQIQEVKLSDIYQSLFQIMGYVQEVAEGRTSINELRTGNITGLPSRTPATSVMALLQEGDKKFDMIRTNWRQGAIANVGKRTFQMIAQRHQAGDVQWANLAQNMLGEDGLKVISVLDQPAAALEEGLGMEVTTTSSQVNREVAKQSFIGLAQFMGQAYAQLIQAAELMGDPSIMQATAGAAYNGGLELLKRLLESFDIQNPEKYLPPSIPGAPTGEQALGLAGINGGGAGGGLPVAPQPINQQIALLQQLAGLGG